MCICVFLVDWWRLCFGFPCLPVHICVLFSVLVYFIVFLYFFLLILAT